MRKPKFRFDVAKINCYKEFFVVTDLGPQVLICADMLINGNLVVNFSALSPIPYQPRNLASFDWEFADVQVTNTQLLYIYGLRQIYILSRAYELSKNKAYMVLAWKFIKSFHKYYFSKCLPNSFANNDHAVAERVENLIYFGYISDIFGYKIPKISILRDLIRAGTEMLYQDKIYQKSHNHGIIVDKALLIGAYCLNNKQTSVMIDQAVSRLKQQVDFGFYPDGVHVENSFDYHIATVNLLRGIINCLILISHPFVEDLVSIINNSVEYIVYAIRPNLKKPVFGDSNGLHMWGNNQLSSTDGYPNLKYIASRGKEGERPSKLTAYFYHAKTVFLREHFDPFVSDQSTWLSFRAGYKTRTHKHQDDLSLCLYSKGFDIFVDPGMYNYMPKNIYKDYMESIPAHTTIGIDNKAYSVARANGENFAIQHVDSKNGYDYILASSHVYDHTVIYRHLYYFRSENIIILRDVVTSDQPHCLTQYFHLGPMMNPQVIDKFRSVCDIGDSGYSVVIKQLSEIDGCDVLNGTKTEPMSVISTGFSSYAETQTIKFYKHSNDFQFLTAIEIKPTRFSLDVDFDAVTINSDGFSMKTIAVAFEDPVPVRFLGVEISCENLSMIIKNRTINPEYREFAVYIYDHETGAIVSKLPYTTGEYLEYTFTSPGNYDLLYYVSNGHREIIKGIVAMIQCNHSVIEVQKIYDELHFPHIGDLNIRKKTDTQYACHLDVSYDFPYRVKWWVYRNGMAQMSQEMGGGSEFLCEIHEPGEFVFMVSVLDPYFGESYFSQSKPVFID